MGKILPIKPGDVVKVKQGTIPDAVIEAFNELIVKKFDGRSATVRQDEVISLLVTKGLKEEAIYENGWLDVEGIYEKSGWEVAYDKPGYNESYAAFFVFTK